eukprot:g5856.t1
MIAHSGRKRHLLKVDGEVSFVLFLGNEGRDLQERWGKISFVKSQLLGKSSRHFLVCVDMVAMLGIPASSHLLGAKLRSGGVVPDLG